MVPRSPSSPAGPRCRSAAQAAAGLTPGFSPQVGASLFASNVGSGHFIGLAGSGAASGIAATAYEWNGMFCVLVLAWLFLPIYISAGVTTMPEYLQRRFGGKRIQLFLAILYLFIYIFTKISVDMYAGALFIQQALHWDLYVAVTGLLVITAIYTVAGGLAAVIYTDALQTVIMLAGALTLMGFSFAKVGGLEDLENRYFQAIASSHDGNSTCGRPREDAFHIFRDPVTSDLPWPGVLVGMTIPSLWYWCTDQVIVQRSLAAKNLSHAKGGALLASCLKILPFFVMVLPGMISRILFPDLVACADPNLCKEICGNPSGCSDIAYPKLVIELLPLGLRGLMMSVMIAALMSSLTSIFNSASTIFTMDLWRHFRPLSSEWELMIVGRVFVLLLVIVSILWIPLVQASQGGQLFIYIQTISSYLQPPVAVVFILGCFWRRTNEKGAFSGLLVGMVLGLLRMVLDFVYMQPQCGEPDNRPGVVKYVHYLYFSMILALVTLVLTVMVSLWTERPPEEMHPCSRVPPQAQPSRLICTPNHTDARAHEHMTFVISFAHLQTSPLTWLYACTCKRNWRAHSAHRAIKVIPLERKGGGMVAGRGHEGHWVPPPAVSGHRFNTAPIRRLPSFTLKALP
uniref:Sodium/myo-inositol cotransporter 2 n=1 Tax=Varanus komodoensis TaxID=61221 RepID=A0A8D2LLL9_VARKO